MAGDSDTQAIGARIRSARNRSGAPLEALRLHERSRSCPLRIIERGEGCYLIDSEGNRLLDGLSNLFCVNVGYS